MTNPGQDERAGWTVVMAAFFGVMVSFASIVVYTFGIFLKPLSREFGWGREQISAAFGLAAMTIAVCSPLLGRLLDRYGPRRVILPCMAVFGVTLGSLAWLTPHLAHFYGVFVLIGIVANGTTQMGYSRAVSSWFVRRRGTALATVMAGVGVGSFVFPYLAQRLIDGPGWRTAYLTLGGMSLLFGLPLTALFVRERPAAAIRSRAECGGMSLREGLRSRAFWLLVAALFLSSIAVNSAIAHLSPLLTDRGVNRDAAALALSLMGASSFIARLTTGSLLDRYSGPRVSFALLSFMACGIALLSVASTPASGIAAGVLIGIGLGGEADVTPYLLTRYFGLRSFSTLYGFTWTAYAFAGGIGPVLMGKVFDLTGTYRPLLLVLTTLTALAAALMIALPRYPEEFESRTAGAGSPDLSPLAGETVLEG